MGGRHTLPGAVFIFFLPVYGLVYIIIYYLFIQSYFDRAIYSTKLIFSRALLEHKEKKIFNPNHRNVHSQRLFFLQIISGDVNQNQLQYQHSFDKVGCQSTKLSVKFFHLHGLAQNLLNLVEFFVALFFLLPVPYNSAKFWVCGIINFTIRLY